MSLGYFVSHKKSTLLPTQRLVHLGYGIDNSIGSFYLTDKHRAKFRSSRDALLTSGTASLVEMQRFLGKLNFFKLVFPGVSLFTLQCRLLLSSLGDSPSTLPPEVLDEIRFWKFVDSFTSPIPFRRQQHVSISLYTDASGFAWGAKVGLPTGPVEFRDYWATDLISADIHVKEAVAVLLAISAFADHFRNLRIDVFCDNQIVVNAWSGLKAHSSDLVGVLRSLFLLCCEFNISLSLIWVPTSANPADAPSRVRKRSDSSLSSSLRRRVWEFFGPFSVDLMALPSNAFRRPDGHVLPFFAPFPAESSSGTNVFAQSRPLGVAYVFPPFCMIVAVIRLLMEWGSVQAVLVLPQFSSLRPSWMQLLRPHVLDQRLLSSPRDLGVLDLPSASGFSPNLLPLGFGLIAYRCSFPPSPTPSPPPPQRHLRVLVVSDSMLRPLERLVWPIPFDVTVRCFRGGLLRDIVFELLRALRSRRFDACVVHGGVNDISKNMPAPQAALDAACAHVSSMLSAHCFIPIVVSTVCQTRRSDLNIGVAYVNAGLRRLVSTNGWSVASHDHIIFSDLSDDVHLNAVGVAKIFRSLHHALRVVFRLPSAFVSGAASAI